MNIYEDKPNYYAVIPATVRYDKRLKANEKLLYGEIACLAHEKGYCWANNQYFATLYEVEKTTISRWLSNLSACGYIDVVLIRDEKQQVVERKIYIKDYFPPRDDKPVSYISTPIDEKDNTLLTKKSIPSPQKNQYPIDEKSKYNNTSLNNTSLIIAPATSSNSAGPSANAEVPSKPLKKMKKAQLESALRTAQMNKLKITNEGNIYHFPMCDVLLDESDDERV